MDANLIVTYEPSHRSSAEREVLAVAGSDAKLMVSDIPGVFLLKTKSDPKKFVHELREEFEQDTSKLRFTSTWVPIEEWCSSDMKELKKTMKKINTRMDEHKSWKIDIHKRHFGTSISELIKELTEPIEKKNVDLGQPEQIVRVEIIKDKAGVALLAPEEILNVSEFVKK